MGIFDGLIIFEMANSHQGDVGHGISIIRNMAKISRKYNIKAAVKLQYRNLDTFIHPDYKGRKDVKHIPRFEGTRLTCEEFSILVSAIKEEGLISISTPFDEDGVEWCQSHGIDIIKVASCSAMDWPLLEKIAGTGKPIILSTGGKSISDIDKIYNFFWHRNCEFAFLHCIAEYPAPMGRLQLDFIDRMKKRYREIAVGYSGHEDPDNQTVPMMAAAKGAVIFERHVGIPTEQIKLNGYSMNPEQADRWVKAIVEARDICTVKKGCDKYISQEELDSLQSLCRGVFARKRIKAGDVLALGDVFFAMPCAEGQMASGEFTPGMAAQRDYIENEALYEKKEYTDIHLARSVIHDAKGLLFEAGIALGNQFEVELSHHYGIQQFRRTGAVIISIVNREYCKKLIVVLPGQQHPMHFHKIKEETFQLLYGDLTCDIGGRPITMRPGDIQTVLRNEKHAFSSKAGAVFEEISTTHVKGDSYYEDPKIAKLDLIKRKTIIREW